MTIESRAPTRVRRMFGRIARHYDLLNHLLSANQDRRWRRAAARTLPPDADRVLDLCGGTGDLTVELARTVEAGTLVCCDFSREMLEVARGKFSKKRVDDRCRLLEADGLALPFADASFDAVTVAFGVRNFVDMDRGFREILRVLRPGAPMVVLEFSRPTGPVLSRLYRLYLGSILPRIGGGVSGNQSAYGYLANTISNFPDAATLAGEIRNAGFAAAGWTELSGGIVAIHTGHKGA